MEVYECTECNFQSIHEKYYCPECRSTAFHKTTTPNTGKVYSYTTIHVPPPEFKDLAPYQVVLVELTEKLRVTGFMKESVEIGETVTVAEVKDNAYIFAKAK